MKQYVTEQLKELSHQLLLLADQTDKIQELADLCIKAILSGHKIIFCGNGGSAGQSQHLAAELVGRYKKNRPALSAISLTVDTSNITAIGNDYGYEYIFSRQLRGIGKSGDVLFGLSTSGNSANVIRAFKKARRMNIQTVALIGKKDGQMKALADYCLQVPATTSAHIQEMHITVGHIICDLVERAVYG